MILFFFIKFITLTMESRNPNEKKKSIINITVHKTYQKPPSDLVSLYTIYQNEFIDNSEQILIQKEQEFLRAFYHRMSLIFLEDYGPDVMDDYSFTKATKDCEAQIYDNMYKPMYSLCQKVMDNYSRNSQKNFKSKDFGYLANFRAHCFYNQIPVHTCKGRFITVNDPNNASKILYVICTNCKMCYFESSILMLCVNCKKTFYSSVISNIEKMLPPATWEKYHCNVMYNAQMECIKCHDKFWIKNNNLYCKNCKFLISPLDVTWNCVICHKDFQSNVKVYNALEFKLIKLAARNAFLYKRIVKPKELPCKCFTDIDSVTFTHKPNCPGVLYHWILSGKDTIFCSCCQTFCSISKFSWFCPKCKRPFMTKNINIYNGDNECTNESRSVGVSKHNSRKAVNPLYNSVVIDNSRKTEDKITKKSYGLISSFDPVDNIGIKKRNFSINLINNRTESKPRKNQSINSNFENTEDIDDYLDESSPNGKLKIHVIKHPQQRKTNLVNKNIERNLLSMNSNIGIAKRCNTIENEYSKEKYNSFNRATTIGGVSNENMPTRGNFRNYQIFIPKRTINVSGSKEQNERKNSLYDTPQQVKDEMKNYYSNKGHNRFKLNYESPSSDRKHKPLITFNMDENEQREKLREYSRKRSESNELIENNDYHHPEIKKILINKNMDKSPSVTKTEYSTASNNHSRLMTSPGKNINFNAELLINSPMMQQTAINMHNNQMKMNDNQLKEFNFSDYQIITQLGQGTFGKIYLVEDKNKNIFSMKKIILSEELDLEGIIKEYQLAHQLQHPNIIEILGFYTKKLDVTTFVIYILMEVGLTDWEKSIKSHSDHKKYYTEGELIKILTQLVSALSFLQSQGVSHRDIKPQNVLIFKNQVYKIADFGEAKQITKIGQNRQINTLRGTELYMSPLLFNGLKTNQLDIKHNLFKSDVYSLGLCILFASTLTVNSIYEIRKLIDMKSVRSFLSRVLKDKYSVAFITLLGDMLEINERVRPDFIQLKARLGAN